MSTPIQQLRLLLATQMETLSEAHAQLRESESFSDPDVTRDCLTEAKQLLIGLAEDVHTIADQIDNLRATRKTLGLRLTR
jgi:hypothetical protein